MKSNEAILLVNLGSPKNLDKKSVREYLNVFLYDDFVFDMFDMCYNLGVGGMRL